MYKEVERQGCNIENIKVLIDYLGGDIESFMEGKDLSPFRRDMGHKCFILIGLINEKLKELEVITSGLDYKIGKILDNNGCMGVFEGKTENENPA